ncbi:MAG: SpoIIE family protein phosphatase [Clostridia bacterium]|nr:SpoIIE family protein phosphatase [Clostridia bacterium]
MEKTNFIEKIKRSSEVKMILLECLTFLLGFLLTPLRFAMGVYPFGIALISATTSYTLFAYAGAILSVFFFMDGSLVYIVGLSAVLILRLIASFISKQEKAHAPLLGEKRQGSFFSDLFLENLSARIFICFAVSFGIGIYSVFTNGYTFYDIFGLVFFSTISPILAYSLSGAFDKTRTKGRLISACAIAFSLIYFLKGKDVLGVDLSIVLSYALVLYSAKNISVGASATLGALFGLSIGTLFAPAFALVGIIAGIVFKFSSYLAIMSAFILAMGYGIYTSGYEAIAYFAPEALGASLIMYPILKFDILPRPAFLRESDKSKSVGEIVLQRQDERTRKDIADMSTSFEEIADMLYETARQVKSPTRQDFEKMCFETAEGYCFSCPKKEICWKRDPETTKLNVLKMSDEAFLKNEVDFRALDERFIHRCPNVEKISYDISKKSKDVIRDNIKNDRLSISANNFELTSKMLSAVSTQPDENDEENLRYSSTVLRVANSLGLDFEKIEVKGGAKKHIIATGIDPKRSLCTGEELRRELESELSIPLESPILTEENGTYSLEINGLATYKTSCAIISKPKGKEANGDCAISFQGKGDKEYYLIADGMGTGDEAHLTSTMCTKFLEKILKVSSEKEIALSILNNFVRAKNVECSSSVDLLEIDLVSKRASFLKSGASPSFIKRGPNVFRLLSKTAPIGIMRKLDAEKLDFNFEEGDICVMLSDGVVSGKDDTSWLSSYLKETELDSPEEIANEILSLAKVHTKAKDDMSVIVILFE